MGHSYSAKCNNCYKNDAKFKIVKKRIITPCYCDLRACQCKPVSRNINLFNSMDEPVSNYCDICQKHKHDCDMKKCFCGYQGEYNRIVEKINKKYSKIKSFMEPPGHRRDEGIFSFYFYGCYDCIKEKEAQKYFTIYDEKGFKKYCK